MEMTPASPGAARPTADLSFPARVWAVYSAPRALFLSLRERPRILGALVLLLLIGAASALLLFGPAMHAQMEALRNKPDMTAEQIKMAETAGKAFALGAFVLGPVVISFVWAAVLLLVSNVFLGGRAAYRQLLSAVLYIGLISLPGLVVKAPLALAKNDINVQTSLAAFLPAAQQKTFLYQFLAQTDLFTLWMWALNILAVSVLAGVPTRRAAYVLGGLWLVVSLGAAALGTLGGAR